MINKVSKSKFDKLDVYGLKEYYYYLRDEENRPVVTVCILAKNGSIISRGVSICSNLDTPCKKAGRKISKQRAYWSFIHKTRHHALKITSPKKLRLSNVDKLMLGCMSSTCEYTPKPLPYEDELVKKVRRSGTMD